MSTNDADQPSDVGIDGTTLAALSLSSPSETQTHSPVGESKETTAFNIGSARPSNYRRQNPSQFYRPRGEQGSAGSYSSDRGRFQRSFGTRGSRQQTRTGPSFPTPLAQQQIQSGNTNSSPNTTPNSHKYIARRRPPPLNPEHIKPNDVYVNLKSNYKAHCEKCKKLLDGKFSEVYIHGLADAIPVAINVAVDLKKFFQGTADFTTRTETVNLIDDLIPTDDATAPTFAKRKVSAINIRVYRTVTIP